MTPLKIVTQPKYSPKMVEVKVWIKEGSRSDPENKKGLHYILGNLLTRGSGSYNSIEFADLVEGCGAGIRCDVNEDGILISLKCAKEDQSLLVPLIGLIITEPKIDIEQVRLEKDLTFQILKKQKESSFQNAFLNWKSIAYKSSYYKYDTTGKREDIRGISREDILTLSKGLKNRDISMVIAGSVEEQEVLEYLKTNEFKTIMDSSLIDYSDDKRKSISCKSKNNKKVITEIQNTSQVVIMYGNPTVSHNSIEDLKLKLLCCHLGNGMSSVLFKRLREDNGLAYDVGIYNPIREYETPFIIHASTTEEKTFQTLSIIKESLNKTLSTKLTATEMNLAKAKLKGNFAHNIQTISQQAERIAILLGFKMHKDHDKRCLEILEDITSEDLINTAQDYLNSPYLSLCGPKETINRINELYKE